MELSDIRRRAADLAATLESAKDALDAEPHPAHRRDELAELERTLRSVQRVCDWLEPEIGPCAEETESGSAWLREEIGRARAQGSEAEARARRTAFARGGDPLEFGAAHAHSELARAKGAYLARFLRLTQRLEAEAAPLPEILRDLEVREAMSALLLWWDIVEKQQGLPPDLLAMAEEKAAYYERRLGELAGTRQPA